jgi:hypothetical protein
MTDIVDYQAVLADLKARRTRLDDLIAGIEAVVGGSAEAVGVGESVSVKLGVGPMPSIHPDTFFGLGIGEAAKKYLKMVRRAQHTAAIADALGKGGLKRPDVNVLSSILVRAAKGREVTKVGKGMWGLAEWYPKPPKEVGEERRKPRKARRSKASSSKKVVASEKQAKAKATHAPRAAQEGAKNGARPSDIAVEIVRTAGKPLHAEEITKRVKERGVAASRLPIESFLSRQVKAGKMQKVGPSTYAMAS